MKSINCAEPREAENAPQGFSEALGCVSTKWKFLPGADLLLTELFRHRIPLERATKNREHEYG
jgi:hypothetical protein